MNHRDLRIGDAERERASADLAEHLAVGRITVEEHAERLDAVWSARTGADLEPVFADLPRLPVGGPPPLPGLPPSPGAGRRRAGLPLLPVVAVLVLLSVLTHLPFWILIFFLGCGGLGRRRPERHRDHQVA